jgi:hypothetical protein
MTKEDRKAWVISKLNSEGDEIFLEDGIEMYWTTDKTQARVFKTRTEARDKIKWEHLHYATVARIRHLVGKVKNNG